MAYAFLEDLPKARFTAETIKRMYRLADRGKTDPDFQKLIYSLANRALPGQWKNYRAEIAAVFDWFKSRHDYRRDPYDVELLQDVWATLDRRRFDCDDGSIFLLSANEVLGAPGRFVTVSTRPDKEPGHVYVEVFVDGAWTCLDPSVPESYVGWCPGNITDKKIWTRRSVGLAGDDDVSGVEGLGMKEDFEQNGFDYHLYQDDALPGPGWFEPPTPEGIPSDVSKTRARLVEGEAIEMKRRFPFMDVRSPADHVNLPRAGGQEDYGSYLRPVSFKTPAELFQLLPRKDIPKVFDPNIWTGEPPVWGADPSFMYPNKSVKQEDYMTDLAGLGVFVSEAEARRVAQAVGRAVADTVREFEQYGPTGMFEGLGQTPQWTVKDSTGKVVGTFDTEQKAKDYVSQQSMFSFETYTVVPPQTAATSPSLIDKLIDWGLNIGKEWLTPSPPAPTVTVTAPRPVVAAGIVPTAGLPGWVLPVGIGVALLAFGGKMLFGGGRRYRRNPRRFRRARRGKALPTFLTMAAVGTGVVLLAKAAKPLTAKEIAAAQLVPTPGGPPSPEAPLPTVSAEMFTM